MVQIFQDIAKPSYLGVPREAFAFTILLSGLITLISMWQYVRLQLQARPPKNPEACCRLGLAVDPQSSIREDVESQFNIQAGRHVTWRVKSLWIYPVKSCRWVQLDQASVIGTGFQYDRQFVFSRYQKTSKAGEAEKWSWIFLTQRQVPKMATIKVEIWVPDASSPVFSENHPNVQSEGVLVIKFPGGSRGSELTVHLPYNPTPKQIHDNGYAVKSMTVWKDSTEALMMATSETPDSWIEKLRLYLELDTRLALLRVVNPLARELYRNAPRRDELGYQPSVCFQDAYPLHILNVASVKDVAAKYEGGDKTLSTRNFRPNIVVEGGAPYAEDLWTRIEINSETYHVSCRTVRCLLPNVNPITGERRDEPNKTLKRFRKVDQGDPKNACLGMQMVPAVNNKRSMAVGDEITVLEVGEHLYVKM